MNSRERTQLVAHFVKEREAIRLRRASGQPPPWTQDPIMAAYRFTNVRREDDRVTRWIDYHWRLPYHDHPNLTLAMAMARFFNWPPTLGEVEFPERWSAAETLKKLKARKARGEKLYNAAYMISTCGARVNKEEHVVGVLNELFLARLAPRDGDTLAGFWEFVTRVRGIGSFLGAQIVADLKHAPANPLATATDFWTWAAPGPGSERGLRWWLGQPKSIRQADFLPRLQEMWRAVGPLVEDTVGALDMQDVQNVMCETSKMVKALKGCRPKQNYRSTEGDYAP